MRHSSAYEHFVSEGRAQGVEEGRAQGVEEGSVLEARTSSSCESANAASALPTQQSGPRSKSMTDLKCLRQLLDKLLSATGWHDLLSDL